MAQGGGGGQDDWDGETGSARSSTCSPCSAWHRMGIRTACGAGVPGLLDEQWADGQGRLELNISDEISGCFLSHSI